jgi:acylphosphatase
MRRLTVHFAGRVQGVGFRATTRHLAAAFAVSGYVQNLPDRRVRLVVEGRPEDLQGLLDAINDRLGLNISQRLIDETEATGEFGRPGVDPLSIRY